MQSLVCSCCSKRDGPYIAQAAEKLPRRCSYICRQNKWPCFKQKQMNTPAKKKEITAGWCHTLCTRYRHEQQTSPPHHPALLLYCHGPLTGSGRVPTRTHACCLAYICRHNLRKEVQVPRDLPHLHQHRVSTPRQRLRTKLPQHLEREKHATATDGGGSLNH